MKPPSRALTTLAVGFLSLDALLLVYAGVDRGRPWLTVAGALCAAGSVLVLLAWRRYRRMVAELEAARREMKREAESIRELLRSHHLHN